MFDVTDASMLCTEWGHMSGTYRASPGCSSTVAASRAARAISCGDPVGQCLWLISGCKSQTVAGGYTVTFLRPRSWKITFS